MRLRGLNDHHLPLDRQTQPQSTGSRAFRILGWSSGFLASLAIGCGGPTAERSDPAAGNLASNPVSARADAPLQIDDPVPTDDSPARQLLDSLIHRYRTADAYSDDARVRLTYRRGEQKHIDEAPLAVALDRPGNLHLRAYAADMVIHDQRLQATIIDPLTDNMDGQRLDQPLLGTTLKLADIYSDATLTHFATAGLGGPAPQLELLMADQPLGGLFDQATELRLDRTASIDGASCDALIIEHNELVYTLWMERETMLLRRVELPTEPTGLTLDPAISEVKLTIELASAAFAVPATEDWQLPAPDDSTAVTAFVPPPPPLVSPHLGRPLPEFQLSDDQGQVLLSNQGSDRDWTVMLWIADHPASQMAARQLQAVADRLADPIGDKTRFVLVMAEASTSDPAATGKMLRRWNVGLPYVNDTHAVGRDVFDVREAPTLCLLGTEGVMHWFQPRVGPELADQLTALLTDLADGKDVGGELRKRYETDQQTYQQMLNEARH